MTNDIVQSSMGIILHAGDARNACKEALEAIAAMDLKLAREKLKEAQGKIVEAHKIQTKAIQAETSGDKSEYSLLFAHAQDTLMTIYSEINIAKQLIKIFQTYETRLKVLEDKMEGLKIE